VTVSIERTTPGIAVHGTGSVVPATVTTGVGGGGGGVELGETSTTAYRGDRGKTAYDHSQVTTGNPHGTTASDVGADPAGTAAGLVDDLSGVSNQATARTNLGLGSAAVEAASAFATAAQGVDARTPTAHKTSHENGGSDELALDASQITTGTVAQDRLGTGSAGAGAKFLADDQTYKTVSGTVDVVSNVATSTILGRTTAGSGDSEELSASTVRTLLKAPQSSDSSVLDIVSITQAAYNALSPPSSTTLYVVLS